MLSKLLPAWLAVPLRLHRKGKGECVPEFSEGASALQARRAHQQKQLFKIVGEALVGHGLLSSSWSFKALRLDRLGERYLVLVTLSVPAAEAGPDLLFSIESWLRPMCLSRVGIEVQEVFWRHDEGRVVSPSSRHQGSSQRLSMTQYGGLHEF